MNGIIHVCSHPEDDNPHFRITEEKIFADIMYYLEVSNFVKSHIMKTRPCNIQKFFWVVKMKIFTGKSLIFFLFLLKTYIVGIR